MLLGYFDLVKISNSGRLLPFVKFAIDVERLRACSLAFLGGFVLDKYSV